MNLINDLDAEIAFAVLVEKKHHEKIEFKDVFLLLSRLNKALENISEKEDSNDLALSPAENLLSRSAVR